ncbi:MAG: hypothetical protein ACRESZ_21615 [Methylococcales bacterium]
MSVTDRQAILAGMPRLLGNGVEHHSYGDNILQTLRRERLRKEW